MNKQNRLIDTENILMAARWKGRRGEGEKGEGIKYNLVVTEQSWGCKVQHWEDSR